MCGRLKHCIYAVKSHLTRKTRCVRKSIKIMFYHGFFTFLGQTCNFTCMAKQFCVLIATRWQNNKSCLVYSRLKPCVLRVKCDLTRKTRVVKRLSESEGVENAGKIARLVNNVPKHMVFFGKWLWKLMLTRVPRFRLRFHQHLNPISSKFEPKCKRKPFKMYYTTLHYNTSKTPRVQDKQHYLHVTIIYRQQYKTTQHNTFD